MTSQASNRPNKPLQRNRLSVSSLHKSTNAGKGDPAGFEKGDSVDDFNYEDYGPSTTPSKKRGEKSKSSASPQGSNVSDDTNDDLPEDLSKRLEILEIWERETKGRRARAPDKISDIGEVPRKPDGTASSRASTAAKGSKRDDWSRRSHSVEPSLPARDANLTRLHRVRLNWVGIPLLIISSIQFLDFDAESQSHELYSHV